MATRAGDIIKKVQAAQSTSAPPLAAASSSASANRSTMPSLLDYSVHPPAAPSADAKKDPLPTNAALNRDYLVQPSQVDRTYSSAAPDRRPEHIDQVASLSEQIMRYYPPDRFHYLGLGRSPTPVIAYMQGLHAHPDVRASNMPLSKFSARHASGQSSGEHPTAKLTWSQAARLDGHFKKFVPGDDVLQGRRILMMDYVQTGQSLFAAHRHLAAHLEKRKGWFSRKPATGLTSLPLTSPDMLDQVSRTVASTRLTEPPLSIPGKLATPTSLAAMMGAKAFEDQAEYPPFKVSQPHPPTHEALMDGRNPAYDQLVSKFSRQGVDGYEADDECK